MANTTLTGAKEPTPLWSQRCADLVLRSAASRAHRNDFAGSVPRLLIGRRPPEVVHRPKTTTDMVNFGHRRLPPCPYVSITYAGLEMAHQLPIEGLVVPPRKGGTSLWGQEADMKKLMMVMVIGLALATTGFAQGRGGSRSGGGRSFSGGGSYGGGHGSGGYSYSANGGRSYGGGNFSSNGRGFGGQFSGQTARGGRFEGGFSGYRGGYGYGRSSFGFGFSYVPGPYWAGYYGPDPYDYGYGPAYYPPVYDPPVVGGVVVGRGFVGGRAFAGRGGDWHRFSRR
jgi:hypothetical protein